MKCPICGGNMKRGLTNLPVELEAGLLYVKQVPADVCGQCEEAFIPDDVAEKLERIVDRARRQKVEIEVVSYQGAA